MAAVCALIAIDQDKSAPSLLVPQTSLKGPDGHTPFFFCTVLGVTLPARHSPYQIWNYTWTIINEAGDHVYYSSSLGSQPPWPTLEVDLCKLALGGT